MEAPVSAFHPYYASSAIFHWNEINAVQKNNIMTVKLKNVSQIKMLRESQKNIFHIFVVKVVKVVNSRGKNKRMNTLLLTHSDKQRVIRSVVRKFETRKITKQRQAMK